MLDNPGVQPWKFYFPGGAPLANKRLSMRKIKEVLRLHFDSGLAQCPISRCTGISRTTVGDYLDRAKREGLCSCRDNDERTGRTHVVAIIVAVAGKQYDQNS